MSKWRPLRKFSPGTWRMVHPEPSVWAVRTQYEMSGCRVTAFLAVCNSGGQNNEGNARLMSEAVTMYETLESLVSRFDRALDGGAPITQSHLLAMRDMAREAIDRADGNASPEERSE